MRYSCRDTPSSSGRQRTYFVRKASDPQALQYYSPQNSLPASGKETMDLVRENDLRQGDVGALIGSISFATHFHPQIGSLIKALNREGILEFSPSSSNYPAMGGLPLEQNTRPTPTRFLTARIQGGDGIRKAGALRSV